jgi:hypothetical protein
MIGLHLEDSDMFCLVPATSEKDTVVAKAPRVYPGLQFTQRRLPMICAIFAWQQEVSWTRECRCGAGRLSGRGRYRK